MASVLSALTLLGGLIAFVRKGSVPSLVGSSVIALLYGAGAALPLHSYGQQFTVSASLLLTIVMGVRAIKTRKLVPIVGLVVGALSLAYFGTFAKK